MSTRHTRELYLCHHEDVDRNVPDLGVRPLPGRVAMVSHPLNAGAQIVVPDREVYDPDVCLVCASGVGYVEPGQVWVTMFERGAYYSDMSPDGREVRLVGAGTKGMIVGGEYVRDRNRPWDVFLAQYGPGNKLAPGPGWLLVEAQEREYGMEVPESMKQGSGIGTVLAGVSVEMGYDGWVETDMAGRLIDLGRYDQQAKGWVGPPTYRFHGSHVPKEWRLVRNPEVPRDWLFAVSRQRSVCRQAAG